MKNEFGLEKAKKIFNHFLQGESIQDTELQMKKKNGEPLWISLSVKPIFDSKGNVIESRSMILDITDRKITEDALKSSEKKYRQAYDMANFYKDLFTHDMNNILQVINSSAEIISYQLGDSEASKFIDNMTKMIRSQVDRGSQLISDVRTLTSLDEEEVITNKTEISRFLYNSIKFVKKAYPDRKISIITKNFDKKYYTYANELLEDVFDNILINAVKYNENETVEVEIKISRQVIDKKDYIQIEIIDNGIGISDARKKLIFQPGNREVKGIKGMGIGLSLVNKIMEIYKGKIWVEDKVKGDYSQGSMFIIILPSLN
jgi:signal transduction histidine kinase